MNKNLHIIRKQNVIVELNGTEADGLALQDRMTVLCEQMTPLVEQVLDRYGAGESHVYIDHIDIDVGLMTVESLERELPEAVTAELAKFLREHLPAGESPQPFVSGNVQHKTAQSSIHEAFIYFLKTGSLPWSFHIPAGETLEQVVSASLQEAEKASIEPISDKDSLLQALSNATVRKRLVRQFSPGFLETLVSFLSPEVNRIMVKVLPTLLQADIPSAIKERIIQRIWETAFSQIAARKTLTALDLVRVARDIPPAIMKKAALSDTLEHIGTQITRGRDIGAGKGIDKAPVGEKPLEIEKSASGHDEDLVSRKDIDKGRGVEKTLETKKPLSGQEEHVGKEKVIDKGPLDEKPLEIEKPASDDSLGSSEHPDALEGIYIGNAGLVILHHFLPQFFGALGVALEGKLVQPGRALCLLHFLATGQTVTPEYELVLPKILCGVPLLTPVETGLELTEPEKEEATALLKSVIRHWDVLRNTSPDGLRGSFLLRHGKVTLREDGEWLLQVEPNSIDILMGQLPWGISMIKLPWMETWLHVEWR